MLTGRETITPEINCINSATPSAMNAADQEFVTSRRYPIVNGPVAEIMYPPPCIKDPKSRDVSGLPERSKTKVKANGNEDPKPTPKRNTQSQVAAGHNP